MVTPENYSDAQTVLRPPIASPASTPDFDFIDDNTYSLRLGAESVVDHEQSAIIGHMGNDLAQVQRTITNPTQIEAVGKNLLAHADETVADTDWVRFITHPDFIRAAGKDIEALKDERDALAAHIKRGDVDRLDVVSALGAWERKIIRIIYNSGIEQTPMSEADRRAEVMKLLVLNRGDREEHVDSLIDSFGETLRVRDPALFLAYQAHFADRTPRPQIDPMIEIAMLDAAEAAQQEPEVTSTETSLSERVIRKVASVFHIHPLTRPSAVMEVPETAEVH
ncbi:MAG: hypothetical protein JWM52_787 [Candidatus Saccharibacteria bacterium]|nr:hypothetical protein [Candidatus Saccharibacteria bacterium]